MKRIRIRQWRKFHHGSADHRERGTYEADVICGNCGKDKKVEIPKGVTIDEYREQHGCEHCGCKMNPYSVIKRRKA